MEDKKKELNLVDVLSLCWQSIKKAFMWGIGILGWCLRMFYQKKWIMLVCLLAGLAWGFWSVRQYNPHRSGFGLNSFCKQPYYAVEQVREAGKHCGRDLAKFLNIDPAVAAQVVSIEPYYVVDIDRNSTIDIIDYKERFRTDSLVYTWSITQFYVEVISRHDSVVPIVRQALLDKLNASFVLYDPWKINMDNEIRWIQVLNDELHRIDSLQSVAYQDNRLIPTIVKKNEPNNEQSYASESRIQSLTREKSTLMNNINAHEIRLKNLSYGPISATTPIVYEGQMRSLKSEMVKFGLLGIILGLGIILLGKYWKAIVAYLNKKD
ncbi:MAG: hypothetical protein ILP04_00415 [Bacteroidales bacterium]|nr:hypothetical protein [Bacteroidales bacterium]